MVLQRKGEIVRRTLLLAAIGLSLSCNQSEAPSVSPTVPISIGSGGPSGGLGVMGVAPSILDHSPQLVCEAAGNVWVPAGQPVFVFGASRDQLCLSRSRVCGIENLKHLCPKSEPEPETGTDPGVVPELTNTCPAYGSLENLYDPPGYGSTQCTRGRRRKCTALYWDGVPRASSASSCPVPFTWCRRMTDTRGPRGMIGTCNTGP